LLRIKRKWQGDKIIQPNQIFNNFSQPSFSEVELHQKKLSMEGRSMLHHMLKISKAVSSPNYLKGREFMMKSEVTICHFCTIPKTNVSDASLMINKKCFQLVQVGAWKFRPHGASVHQS
jgi:hypothetical protein